jgi:hypothetical protein
MLGFCPFSLRLIWRLKNAKNIYQKSRPREGGGPSWVSQAQRKLGPRLRGDRVSWRIHSHYLDADQLNLRFAFHALRSVKVATIASLGV